MDLSLSKNCKGDGNGVPMADGKSSSFDNDGISTAEESIETSTSTIPMEISSTICNGPSLVDERMDTNENKSTIIKTFGNKKEATTTTEGKKSSPLQNRNTNNYTIPDNSGILSIIFDPYGPQISRNAKNTIDFYVTPDNTKRNGVKRHVPAANRALDFNGGPAPTSDGEKAAKHRRRPKSDKKLSKQQPIPYPCHKAKSVKAPPSLASRPSQVQSTAECENNVYIENNSGIIIVGNNHNTKENNNKDLGENEVEVDGSCSSRSPNASPEKSLQVNMDEMYEVFFEHFHHLTNSLHPLRDNGKFEEFYIAAAGFEKDYRNQQHLQIIIMIERSMALNYQIDFHKSEELINEAVAMISNPGVEMKNFLLAYSHCQITGLNRRKNHSWKANYSVVMAQNTEEFIPFCVIHVFVAYERASNLTKELSLISIAESEARLPLMDEAKKELKHCISLAERVLEESGFIYLQRHLFCLVKLASMNLNCRTTTSRLNPVDEESINEAECCILKMEEYEGDTSKALGIQLYVAKCDLHFRKNDFYEAQRYAQQALEIAIANNIHLEVKPIQERLNDINKQIRGEVTRP